MDQQYNSFDEVKARLDEIEASVKDKDISLDDALALYEEAVELGLKACNLSEQDILSKDQEFIEEEIEDLQGESAQTDQNVAVEVSDTEGAATDSLVDDASINVAISTDDDLPSNQGSIK